MSFTRRRARSCLAPDGASASCTVGRGGFCAKTERGERPHSHVEDAGIPRASSGRSPGFVREERQPLRTEGETRGTAITTAIARATVVVFQRRHMRGRLLAVATGVDQCAAVTTYSTLRVGDHSRPLRRPNGQARQERDQQEPRTLARLPRPVIPRSVAAILPQHRRRRGRSKLVSRLP